MGYQAQDTKPFIIKLFIGWLAVPGTVDLEPDKNYYTTLVDQKVWYFRVRIQDHISQNKKK